MTLEELYNKVMSDRNIMGEFVKASGTGKLTEFAGKYDCSATDGEVRRYFAAQCEGEIEDDDLDIAAGGTVNFAQLFGRLYGIKS